MKQVLSTYDLAPSELCLNFNLKRTLKSDEYYAGIMPLVYKVSLGYKITEKVEMHILITKGLFLMYKTNTFIDYSSQKIFLTTQETDEEVYYCFDHLSDAYRHVSELLHNSIYDPENGDEYETYRHLTRQITDHIEDEHDLRSVWNSLVDLTDKHLG